MEIDFVNRFGDNNVNYSSFQKPPSLLLIFNYFDEDKWERFVAKMFDCANVLIFRKLLPIARDNCCHMTVNK